ncbi:MULTISPECIES: molybdopterin cofactor-binding domain-containing protein [Paraburkholderia]|uniref:xanthine dehydrogenase family protein molybdopterin-binding subunit n=1 Tax=Paraburkholderia TaxID=1822464 RepID=UPI00225B9328|nr:MULTISPECIES: molybdopterin cofactor-binding domain-containing protein [Paraburkholderia]MCX4162050.1 molybdopterin-dependent oxidoreductase [Paraburkholderia megapolitana]MDN7157545.1 molybdopterin-dependent oxidoreductase [Paraburkholderia sp. CHISQ3]MDQ6494592.1 molybdopterin-dependent oxidoreductase [Paraburkholderia megapolitana]
MTSRRQLLKMGGGLAISFSLPLFMPQSISPAYAITGNETEAPKSQDAGHIGAWLSIARNGAVTLYAGKVELGTGVQTALAQLVAEELDVSVASVTVTMGDTSIAIDQGGTFGSMTIKNSALPVRRACATARMFLVKQASNALGVPISQLSTRDGYVRVTSNPQHAVAYGDVIPPTWATLPVDKEATLKRASAFDVIGKPVQRIDLPEKVAGTHAYLQNLRLPGMVHARVIHPPLSGATLIDVDRKSVTDLPGFIAVFVKHNFVAVVCEQEFQAVSASRTLVVKWKLPQDSIESSAIYDTMRAEQGETEELRQAGDASHAFDKASRRLSVTYRTPYQTHGSIGPSCGVADVKNDSAVVWSATQSSFGTRDAIAALINLPASKVRLVWVEGSGCYGHNGADDASAEAAVLSQAFKRPVRVHWMRHDEHGWDPKGPAMEIQVKGSIGATGRVDSWAYLVSTPTHISRPFGNAGNLLPGRMLGLSPKPIRYGGDDCARTLYHFSDERVAVRWLPDGVLRPSAMRGLGAVANAFANESFLDELASLSSRDPVELRLTHLSDARAIAVLREVRAISNWAARRVNTNKRGATVREGVGVALAQLEPGGAYVAMVCQTSVDTHSGEIRVTRVFVAHDCGLIVNPDGLRNQIQGGVVQALSRSLKEEVHFDSKAMLSLDWTSYPILRFSELPSEITISLLNRPDQPPVGAGEPVALTVAPAISNAVFHATGVRLRKTPFTPVEFKANYRIEDLAR